ncbi:hypothetical protein D3C71_535490 [compost metagenome]
MLYAADILIDRQPAGGGGLVDRLVGLGIGKAGEVPAGIDEGVEGVGLATGFAAAGRAVDVLPGRVTVQRIAGHVEGHVLGQLDRQLVGGDRHGTAGLAVDDGDGAAPVALAADAPVAQAVDGLGFAGRSALDAGDGLGLGGFDVQTVQEVGMEDGAGAGIGLSSHGEVVAGALGADDGDDRQAVFAGEVQVALVVGRAGEDGARAVFRQDEVGDPDRNLGAGEGMDDLQPRVPADLLGLFDLGLRGAALAAFGDEGGDLGVSLGQLLRDGVIGGQADEAGAEQGVGAGGVDLDGVVTGRGRVGREGPLHLQTLGPADPVFLHQADLVGPAAFQFRQAVDQIVRILSNAQEPLVQLALLHQGARAPAASVDDLFVGQDRIVDRVPVDHAVLAIDQTAFVQLQEPGLLLAVIGRVAGGELAAPVQRQAQQLQLVAHGGDVGPGPVAGVDAALHGRVLGRHAEGVPAHGVQDVEALRPLVTRHHVAHHIVAGVAHVDVARRIGEHLEDVIGRTAGVGVGHRKGVSSRPAGLLAGFGGLGLVTSGHGVS